MECCDLCGAPLLHVDLIANPRYGFDLCGICAGEIAEAEAMDDAEAEIA